MRTLIFWVGDLRKNICDQNVVLNIKCCSCKLQTACGTFFLSFAPQPNTTIIPKVLVLSWMFRMCTCVCTFAHIHRLSICPSLSPFLSLSLSHTHINTLSYPMGSFWNFGKETPTAATERGAGVLTPGSGSLPIKIHRTKNIPPH